MKGLTYDANLKPKINSLIKFLNDEGVEKISLLGFSWLVPLLYFIHSYFFISYIYSNYKGRLGRNECIS